MATLIDGRQVCTWCEDWRAETEARQILSMPKADRKPHLYGVTQFEDGGRVRVVKKGIAQIRGKEAADELAALVRRVWEHERKY